MEQQRLTYLIQQLNADLATEAEVRELNGYFRQEPDGDLFTQTMAALLEQAPTALGDVQPHGHLAAKVLKVDKSADHELLTLPPAHRVHFLRTAWFRYAAIVLLIASAATYVYINKASQVNITGTAELQPVIQPGGNKAILTLSDGRTVVLDSTANGAVVSQVGANIIKTDAGKLAYRGTALKGVVGYNMITTPKGGQYQVLLPDGSKVWLNAASSIKFPTAFKGSIRSVEITGEVYMEIAAITRQPFVVKANGAEIQVLGTSFNVNSYPEEEAVKATLIDGSVKINSSVILKPRQQAVIRSGIIKVRKEADIDQVIAWKNGLFNFNGADVKTVMRQLGRWYAIDIVYEGSDSDLNIMGKMYRNVNLSDALELLKNLGLRYKWAGKTLVIF